MNKCRHEVRETLRVVQDPQTQAFFQDPEYFQDVDPTEMQAALNAGAYRQLATLDRRTIYTHALQDVFGRWTLLRCVPVSPLR